MLVNICLPAWPLDIIDVVMEYLKSQGIYLFGGTGIFTKSVFLLRPNNACNDVTIEELPSLLRARFKSGAIRIKDIIYLVGGSDERSLALSSMDCYDIRTRTWSNGPSMAVPRRAHVMIVPFEPHSFVVTGGEDQENNSSCEIYNTETKEWSSEHDKTKYWSQPRTSEWWMAEPFCSLSSGSVAFEKNLYVFESGEYKCLRYININININVKI